MRLAVEAALKRDLPGIRIDVPAKGVGDRQLFPTASEDNAAVDRSVVVMVELASMHLSMRTQHRAPTRVYASTRSWSLKVLDVIKGGGLGFGIVRLKIAIRNPFTGKEAVLSGSLFGGAPAISGRSRYWRSPDRDTPTR